MRRIKTWIVFMVVFVCVLSIGVGVKAESAAGDLFLNVGDCVTVSNSSIL